MQYNFALITKEKFMNFRMFALKNNYSHLLKNDIKDDAKYRQNSSFHKIPYAIKNEWKNLLKT